MSVESNRPCNGCGALPGERHRDMDDIARCRSTGQQWIQCGGENHIYNGRWYGEHDGPCEADVWDGEYPGVKRCREYNLYTAPDSIFKGSEDLNTLHAYASWDAEKEEYMIPDDLLTRLRDRK